MERGRVGEGRLYSLSRLSGSKRGCSPPQPVTSILPLSPTKMMPSSGSSSRFCSSSPGRSGSSPPSYQCSLTGGMSPRELEQNRELDPEDGIIFVGDKGKMLVT